MKMIFFLLTTILAAEMPFAPLPSDQKVAVQNSILAQVNGKTISMFDVKKKMDMLFHQNYPQFAGSAPALMQFYEASWRPVLTDLIDNELILSDAGDKDIKLTDGDIREVMEERFGPNVLQTLDKIGLTYDETWKMVKDELIVQRMNWWFIQSKAIQSVTPQDIRQAYRLYLAENPSYTDWKYRVVSIQVEKPNEELANQIHQLLVDSNAKPEALAEKLKSFQVPGVTIQVSNEYSAKTQDLAEAHKTALATLANHSYSKPTFQKSRAGRNSLYRIFYLVDKEEHPAPSFEELFSQLRNQLIQKAIANESQVYLGKLRKHFGYNTTKDLPEDLHPFSIQ